MFYPKFGVCYLPVPGMVAGGGTWHVVMVDLEEGAVTPLPKVKLVADHNSQIFWIGAVATMERCFIERSPDEVVK